jgi:hypothetical protein
VTTPRHKGWCAGKARVIWRKLDCLNPSSRKVLKRAACRKDACNRYRPLWRCEPTSAAILRGAGAMPSEGI